MNRLDERMRRRGFIRRGGTIWTRRGKNCTTADVLVTEESDVRFYWEVYLSDQIGPFSLAWGYAVNPVDAAQRANAAAKKHGVI